MKEPYGEDLASRPDPESCVRIGNVAGEALTGAHAGQPSSCEIRSSGVPTLFSEVEGHTEVGVLGEPPSDPAQSETLCMRGNSSGGKREIPQVPTGLVPRGRSGKAIGRTPDMHAWGKSDDCVVCAGQRLDPGGSSPPAARMRGGLSKDGGNASSAGSATTVNPKRARSRKRRTQPRGRTYRRARSARTTGGQGVRREAGSERHVEKYRAVIEGGHPHDEPVGQRWGKVEPALWGRRRVSSTPRIKVFAGGTVRKIKA
jgi:hypothetical protein